MMYEGLIALLWCLLWWWWFVEDSPDQDRSITDQELEYLQNTIGVCFLHPFSVGSLTMLGEGVVMEMLSTLSFIFRSVATWQTHSELTGSCPPPTLGSCSHVGLTLAR